MNFGRDRVDSISGGGRLNQKIHVVKSGIALEVTCEPTHPSGSMKGVDVDRTVQRPPQKEVITSRTARVLLAGAGFLADAYDLFVINMVTRLLRDEHPQYVADGTITDLEGMIASSALVGAIVGQLVAGSMADMVGRKIIFVCTAILITFGNLGAASSYEGGVLTVYHRIAFFRFFLGMGVGGRRGTLMASVFAMQGLGSLLSVLVVAVCLHVGSSNNFTWRFALAFGAVPSILAFPWRVRMHETESYNILNRERATGISQSRWSELSRAFRGYKWHVVGTALTWFLLDIDFYANGLFNHDVTSTLLSGGRPTTAVMDAHNAAILCLIAVPGYYMAVRHIETFGRKEMQLGGFIAIGMLFVVCGYGHDWFIGIEESVVPLRVRQTLFLLMYSLTFFFSNFGPNTTTFLIPGEVYPPEVRATCHGLSASMGKLGAALGAYFFPMLMKKHGLSVCMYICAVVALLGAVVTHLFTPRYSACDLEEEGSYIPLEHSCLRPRLEEQALLGKGSYYQRMKTYEMPEVIENAGAVDFMDWLDDDDHVTTEENSGEREFRGGVRC